MNVVEANGLLADLYHDADNNPVYWLVKYHGVLRLMYSNPSTDKEECIHKLYIPRVGKDDHQNINTMLSRVVVHQWQLKFPPINL